MSTSVLGPVDVQYILKTTPRGALFPNSDSSSPLILKIPPKALGTRRQYVFHGEVQLTSSSSVEVTVPIFVNVLDDPSPVCSLTGPTLISTECDFEVDASKSLGGAQQAEIKKCPSLSSLNRLKYSETLEQGIQTVEWFCYRFITAGTRSFYEKHPINAEDPPLGARNCIGNEALGLRRKGESRGDRHILIASFTSGKLSVPAHAITPGHIIFIARVRDSATGKSDSARVSLHVIGNAVPLSLQIDPPPSIISPHEQYLFSAKVFSNPKCSIWREKFDTLHIRSYLRPVTDSEKWVELDTLPRVLDGEQILMQLRPFLVTPGHQYYLMIFVSDTAESLALNIIKSEASLHSKQVQYERWPHAVTVETPPHVTEISSSGKLSIANPVALRSSLTLSISASLSTQSADRFLRYSFIVSSSPSITPLTEIYHIARDSLSPTIKTRFSGTTQLVYVFGRARTAQHSTCFLPCHVDAIPLHKDLCAPPGGEVPICPRLTVTVSAPQQDITILSLLQEIAKSWEPLLLLGDLHALFNAVDIVPHIVSASSSTNLSPQEGAQFVQILEKAVELRSDQQATAMSRMMISSAAVFLSAWERTTGLGRLAPTDAVILLNLLKRSLVEAGCEWDARPSTTITEMLSLMTRAISEESYGDAKTSISLRLLSIMVRERRAKMTLRVRFPSDTRYTTSA